MENKIINLLSAGSKITQIKVKKNQFRPIQLLQILSWQHIMRLSSVLYGPRVPVSTPDNISCS